MSQPFIGEIRLVGFNFAPSGWALCNGQLLDISQNNALFALIGTTYGGDGVQTFQLPNLQSRIPLHQGTSQGGNNYLIGQLAGEEQHTLIVNEMPQHSHAVPVAVAGTVAVPTANVFGGAAVALYNAPDGTLMNTGVIGIAGSSQPHENRMPFLTINFVIALNGIFPTRN